MLFNLEYDREDIIEGYLIPDGFSNEPVVKVTLDDGSSFLQPCDQMRQAALDAGRHATGLVGFRLDASNTPDLAAQSGLSVRDADTGLLIYRRPGARKTLDMKLFRLELRMIPAIKLDKQCGHKFQYAMSAAERFGNETTLQMFHLNAINSIYVSGRLPLRGYEEFLDKGFHFVGSIPEPYYEMASRLFILKRLSREPVTFISDRDQIFLQPAARHFAEVNLQDEGAVRRALKRADGKVRNVLVSPVTRQLVCSDPEQQVTRRDIAAAIDAVSRFTTVGYDNDVGHFHQAIGELLDIPPVELPITPRYAFLEEMAERLRTMQIAETMLEEDLIFDYYVRQAVAPEPATLTEASS
ncbi:hypothetical protein [Hoeflea ulvae]|uniref:Uncharacterized protein n=1 Tax=Hoeflea ulvae TaxID=2983764 RepID=A0ABT3YKF9_9HYPH|nr:hypothetical protein [Hoeflea ulvae]MCY0096385.1 hypothetical protein [Hoeflea ulvae]